MLEDGGDDAVHDGCVEAVRGERGGEGLRVELDAD